MRYYEMAYGAALGHPHLTEGQWKEIIVTAQRQTHRRRKLTFAIPLGVAHGLLCGTVFYAIFVFGPRHPSYPALYFTCLAGLGGIISAIVFLMATPLIYRPAARRAALELGFIQLCTECGYSLTGNTSGKCPECGASALTNS